MKESNTGQDALLHKALEKLSGEFLHHPDVSLIDIGFKNQAGRFTDEVVLRIHVRRAIATNDNGPFPKEVDGIPVIVMVADYKPDAGA
jgi:hypothetical protein